jgi:6-phosphogluconate dehydrogenase
MTTPRCDISIIGLGVMGANLARNLADKGYCVAGYDRSSEHARDVAAQHPEAELQIF